MGAVPAVLWIIVLALGFGWEWWPLISGIIPLLISVLALWCVWRMSAYRGLCSGVLSTVLMAVFNIMLCIAAVCTGCYMKGILSIVLAFVQIIWFIFYIALAAERYIRVALEKREA
ncbi:MAG: hypothetical protein LUE27_08060 [Clostridia bacterium]|nr:hypothetical protein [Clostridia bacterium]